MTALILALLILIYFFRLAVVRTRKASFSDLMPDSDAFREHMQVLAQDREWLISRPHEQVSVVSRDDLTLRARLFKAGASDRFVLLSHGYRSSALWEFPTVARFYLDMGYGVLMIDQRASGESDGRYIGLGALEQHDLVRWAEYLADRYPGCVIFLDGVSMGATAVMLSLGQPLPKNVRGAIADCGFTSPMAIMRHVQRAAYPMSGGWVVQGVRLMVLLIARYDPARCSTLDALKKTATPVLFLHGDADRFVPVEMTLKNYEACASEKQLLIVPGAGHGESYVLDKPGCEQAIRAFFEKYGAP